MKINICGKYYSEIGEVTDLVDGNNVRLFVGDQVSLVGVDKWGYFHIFIGITVITKLLNGNYDVAFLDVFKKRGYDYNIMIYKVKGWRDVVDKECINELGIKYMENG